MPQFRAEVSSSRTSITAGLILAALLSSRACRAANVTWSSPSAGDVYGPGAYILGEWTTDTPIASPSFQLCVADTDNTGAPATDDTCGTAVQPAMQQDPDTGSYQITLMAPNVTQNSDYYLAMLDTAGDMFTSPIFTLASNTSDSSNTAPAAPPSPTSTPQLNAPVASSGDPSSPSAKPITQHNAAEPQVQPFSMDQTRMPAPTAAYAVPLSLAGAVILLAGALGIHQHRALVRERAAEKARLARSAGPARAGFLHSRASSVASLGADEKGADAELGLRRGMPPRGDSYTRVYVPQLSIEQRGRLRALRHAHSQPRETTREPFTPRDGLAQDVNATPTRSTVPAGLFKASPRIPYASPSPAPRVGTGHTPASHPSGAAQDINGQTDYDDGDFDVVSHYLQPSPVPPNPATPQPAHVRRSANLTPSAHQQTDSPGDLYDQVARKVSGRYNDR